MTVRPGVRRVTTGVLLLVVLPLAVLARVGWRPLTRIDRNADGHAHTLVLAHDWLLSLARALTHLGDPTVVTVGAAVGAVVMWLAGRRSAAVYLVAVRLVAVVLGALIKDAVHRSRPVLPHPVAHAGGFSFPSGHALGSAAFYGSLAVVLSGRTPTAVRLAVAVLPPIVVAATRVLLGVHFPSDVVAGLLVGWATALLVAAVVPP